MAAATIEYISGLDLGQAADFTALVVVEKTEAPDPKAPEQIRRDYAIRHLERMELGTPYTVITERVARIMSTPPLPGSTLAVDQTGVGRPVVDMLYKARMPVHVRPITITAGSAVVPDGQGFHVPKKELVSVLQVLLQSRRLRWPRSLPESQLLAKELANFRVKITAAAHETFAAWREGQHDDLVLALAMACWLPERGLKKLCVWI